MKHWIESTTTIITAVATVAAAIASAVAALVAVVGLFLVVGQLKAAREEFEQYKQVTRIEQLLHLHDEFASDRMLYLRAQAAKGCPPKAVNQEVVQILNFFEKVSDVQEAGLVSTEDLWNYFGDSILVYWCGWEKWIRDVRKENPSYGDAWTGLEGMAQELLRDKGAPCYSAAQIKYHLEAEIDTYTSLQQTRGRIDTPAAIRGEIVQPVMGKGPAASSRPN